MDNVATTLAPSFLIEFSLFLQVTRSTIKAYMGLKFGQTRPWTVELAALECLKNPQAYNGRNVVTTPMLSYFNKS